jgi:SPP1 gp7 family putative phage head morphogenesis protein
MSPNSPYVVNQLAQLRDAHLHNTWDTNKQAEIFAVFNELMAKADKIARSGEVDSIVNNWYNERSTAEALIAFELIAETDTKACSVCTSADGIIIPAELCAPGYTMPPFHPNCRCHISQVLSVQSLDEFYEWRLRGKEYATDIWLVSYEDLSRLGWYGVTAKMISEFNETQIKYEILTLEQVKHFLAQCAKETLKGKTLAEKGRTSKYKGAGYIQMTNEYEYHAYATYLIAAKYPEFGIKAKFSSGTGPDILASDYRLAVEMARENGYDISEFTAIVDEGANYVSQHFAWDCSGYYWMAHKLNARISALPPRSRWAVDKVTDIINNGAKDRDGRKNYYSEIDEYIGK